MRSCCVLLENISENGKITKYLSTTAAIAEDSDLKQKLFYLSIGKCTPQSTWITNYWDIAIRFYFLFKTRKKHYFIDFIK